MTKQIDLDPKNVRRVVHYPRFFFVYGTVLAVVWIIVALVASGWQWGTAAAFMIPAFALGAICGIKFRDLP